MSIKTMEKSMSDETLALFRQRIIEGWDVEDNSVQGQFFRAYKSLKVLLEDPRGEEDVSMDQSSTSNIAPHHSSEANEIVSIPKEINTLLQEPECIFTITEAVEVAPLTKMDTSSPEPSTNLQPAFDNISVKSEVDPLDESSGSNNNPINALDQIIFNDQVRNLIS